MNRKLSKLCESSAVEDICESSAAEVVQTFCPAGTTRRCVMNIIKKIHPDKAPEYAELCKHLVSELLSFLKQETLSVPLSSLLTWNYDEVYCSKKAMTQYSTTCYMAAACTVAYRMIQKMQQFQFLHDDNYSSTVKDFLKNMKVSMESCLQPPVLINKAYTILVESPLLTTNYYTVQIDRSFLSNVERTKVIYDLPGYDVIFFIALMALYGLVVRYSPLRSDEPNIDLSTLNNDEIVVLHMMCREKMSNLLHVLQTKSKDLNVHAVLIVLERVDATGHSICAFPCRGEFVFCNSWGNPCGNFSEILEEFRGQFTIVRKLSFICSGVKLTRAKSAPNANATNEVNSMASSPWFITNITSTTIIKYVGKKGDQHHGPLKREDIQKLSLNIKEGHIPLLQTLVLSGAEINDNDVTRIMQALINCKNFTHLTLENNAIEDKGMDVISSASFHLKFTHLNLSQNNITSKGILSFSKAVRDENFRHLRLFDIGDNSIEKQGMRILASVFIFMPVLTQLRIRKNNIGSEGTAYLANAIRNAQALSRLTVLDISENAIEAQGMEALAFVLNYVLNLTELNLGQNKIGNAGAKSLSQAIRNKRLSAVTLLSLDDNNIGDEGMEALSLAFSTRPSPAIDVYLTNNSITVHTKKRRVENVSFKFDKV